MKLCLTCNTNKNESEFHKNKSKKDGIASQCKSCKLHKQKEWYEKNKTKHIKSVSKNKKTIIERNRQFLRTQKLKCVDCGEDNPFCLDFDHIDPNDKNFTLSQMIYQGYGLKRIKEEIDKCEVRCANCHRKRTAEQFGWGVW